MINKVLINLCVACIGLLMCTTSASAVTNCSSVSIVAAGTTLSTDSGVVLTVRNDTGADCGALLDGAEMKYYLAPGENVDKTFATILTAISLEKQMFIQVAGSGEKFSYVTVAYIKN